MTRKARPYQEKAINDCSYHVSIGNRKILIYLGTGGGKGFIIPEIARKAIAKGSRVCFVVHGRSLIFQARDEQFRGIKTSVAMGSLRGYDPNCQVQLCSIDTLKGKLDNKYQAIKECDLYLIDEAHQSVNDGYVNFLKSVNQNAVFIGFTATPFPVNGRAHEFWDVCINPISSREMRDYGYLTDCKTYSPYIPEIKLKGQEYDEQEVFNIYTNNEIIKDVVGKYKKFGQDKPFIFFAVNVEHSKIQAKAFCEAGIACVHCDGESPQNEREAAKNGLRNGTLKGICNVNIFSTGTDIPCLEVGISGRPTGSEVLWVQQIGRILRPYKICKNCGKERGAEIECPLCQSMELSYEKRYAILLDHSGNTARFGGPFKDRQPALDQKYFDRKKLEPKLDYIICKRCDYILDEEEEKDNLEYCPMCGAKMKREFNKSSEIREVEGELRNHDPEFDQRILKTKMITRYRQMDTLQKLRRWKDEFKYLKLFQEFGTDLKLVCDQINLSPLYVDSLENKRKMKLIKSSEKLIKDLSYSPDNFIKG